jgi:beta-lactam-binding protein with PASTA domain
VRDRSKHFFNRLLGMSLVKIAAGATVFLASAVFFGLLALNLIIKQGEKVVVPNVVNKNLVEALDLLSQRGLELKKSGARNSSLIPENYVVSQDPLPGSVVKEGAPVGVVISLGSKISLVPEITGKSFREAQVELTGAGLKVGRLTRIHHAKAADMVLAQWPESKQQVERDTTVDLLLSLGPAPARYRMPDFAGHSLEQVNQTLGVMGVHVGDIVTKIDFARQQGTVLDQDPRPGSLVHQGDSVALVVSSLRGEGNRPEREHAVFIYQVPYGFWSRSVRIEVADPEGTRVVYNEIDEPGAGIRIAFGYSGQCTVKVYLDDVLETERTMR